MNIEEVFEEQSLKCKAFSGAVSTQNFNNKEEFAVLSDRKKGHYEQDTCFQAASLSKLIAAITTALYCEDNNIA